MPVQAQRAMKRRGSIEALPSVLAPLLQAAHEHEARSASTAVDRWSVVQQYQCMQYSLLDTPPPRVQQQQAHLR